MESAFGMEQRDSMIWTLARLRMGKVSGRGSDANDRATRPGRFDQHAAVARAHKTRVVRGDEQHETRPGLLGPVPHEGEPRLDAGLAHGAGHLVDRDGRVGDTSPAL